MKNSNRGKKKSANNILARLKSINKGYLQREKMDFGNNLLLILIDSIAKVIWKLSDCPISFIRLQERLVIRLAF